MTDDLHRANDETLTEATPATEETSVSNGTASLTGQAAAPLVVSRPAAGQTVVVDPAQDQPTVLDFNPAAAQVQIDGDDLVLGFDEDGDGAIDSRIVFQDLAADSSEIVTFQIAGTEVGSDVLVNQALALAGRDEAPLTEVAAGPGAQSGGASAYDDNLGEILDLLVAQGVIPPTSLEFGLIDLEDDPVALDEAEGEISLTFLTETDSTGGAVNTFEGGFEDWQPNQDDCGGETAPMQVIVGFTPDDNEELVSLTLSGIPAGAVLYVGGTGPANIVDTSSGASPLLTPADLASGLFLLPPQDSGDDIPLTVTATISDPDSGSTAVISGSATAIIDSVADNPEFLLDGEEGPGQQYALIQQDYSGGEGSRDIGDDCEVPAAGLTYNEDNGVLPYGGDSYDDQAPIFGAGFEAAVTDIDGSESLTKIAIATRDEYWSEDQGGLGDALSASDDASKTNFMIGEQVLVHGDTVEVVADFADGSTGLATATVEIVDGVLTLIFDAADRVQSVDLSGDSATPFQVRLPLHSDDDFQLDLEVTATEYDIDGELTLDNNVATHQAVLQVNVQAIADGAGLDASVSAATFAEDDESDPANHGEDSGESPLVISLDTLSAGLIDKDGSEAITKLKVTLEGADDGATFVDAAGDPLGGTLQIEVAEGVFLSADVEIVGNSLTLTFDDDAAGYDIDLSGLIQVKLPVDDSDDFTVHFEATTAEVNAEGSVTLYQKTSETSFDVQVQGVAGPAAITFGDYANFPGCETPLVAGNSILLTPFEDGQSSVDGQDGAGPLTVPLSFTAAAQDADGSEGVTEITFSLDGAAEGTIFVNGLGNALEAGDVVNGGEVSFDGDNLVLTFAAPGVASVEISEVFVKLPLHSDDDFSIRIETTTTEYDDDGFGALVDSFTTDAVINVQIDAVADPVTVAITVNDNDDPETQFSPGETGTVKVEASFGDLDDGSEAHTVTVDIPAGFTVGALSGLPDGVAAEINGEGDVVFTLDSGVASLDYTFEVTAPTEGVTDDSIFHFAATARAEEVNLEGEDCTTGNNVATMTDAQDVSGEAAGEPTVGAEVVGAEVIKEDDPTEVQITADTTTVGDTLTQVVITAPAGWVLNATAGGDIASVSGDGTTSLTLTLVGGG